MSLHPSRALSLALCLVLMSVCNGVRGMWFGRPAEGWMRNRVVWQRPQSEETPDHDGRLVGPEDRARYQDSLDQSSWPFEEEDDKRNGQLSSKILFNLIREPTANTSPLTDKGRSSTTKRSAGCEPSEFRCAEDGSCIPEGLLCNGQPDCPMGSDESRCKFPARRDSSQGDGVRVNPSNPATHSIHERMYNECVQRLINGLRIAGPFSRSFKCPEGYSKCALQRQCYDDRYACDGYIDCLDGSDESHCASTPCSAAGYIKCHNQWQCFDRTRMCDGQVDCNDGSDERNCENEECLGEDQVKCRDQKQCYKSKYTCDAIIDCADGSDEDNCSLHECEVGYQKCDNNLQCYNESKRCDGIVQCVDRSDELDCWQQQQAPANTSSTTELQWQCNHEPCADGTKCYLWHLRCDGFPACDDGSDEWNCAQTSCPDRKVKCADRSQCIWEEWLCDGEVHCQDGSEERGCSVYVPQVTNQAGTTEIEAAVYETVKPTTPLTATTGTPEPVTTTCSP